MRRLATFAVVLVVLYAGTFALLYQMRRPAANLLFWTYPLGPLSSAAWVVFYPIYRPCRWLGWVERHTQDRPPVLDVLP